MMKDGFEEAQRILKVSTDPLLVLQLHSGSALTAMLVNKAFRNVALVLHPDKQLHDRHADGVLRQAFQVVMDSREQLLQQLREGAERPLPIHRDQERSTKPRAADATTDRSTTQERPAHPRASAGQDAQKRRADPLVEMYRRRDEAKALRRQRRKRDREEDHGTDG